MSKKNLVIVELFVAIYWLASLTSIILNSQLESSVLNQTAFFILLIMNIPIFIIYRLAATKHNLPLASKVMSSPKLSQSSLFERNSSDLRSTQF